MHSKVKTNTLLCSKIILQLPCGRKISNQTVLQSLSILKAVFQGYDLTTANLTSLSINRYIHVQSLFYYLFSLWDV